MSFLDEYLMPVRRRSREQFVAKEAPFFLVCSHEPTGNKEWSFLTDSISRNRIAIASFIAHEKITVANDVSRYEVFPVTKTQRNPWKDHVSVGRARNNDIVLPDTSVSKVHAHISVNTDGTITVTDAGSRNGTRVKATNLLDGKSATATSGDKVTFGRIEALLLNAGALYDFVARRMQPMTP